MKHESSDKQPASKEEKKLHMRAVYDFIRGKEYAGIPDDTISYYVEKITNINPKLKHLLEEPLDENRPAKEFKDVQKAVRAELHYVYGSYHTREITKIDKLLNQLEEQLDTTEFAHTKEIHLKLLAAHRSTKERIPILDTFYKKIFAETGHPKKLIDIACGLQPLSYPWYGPCEVKAYELSSLECDIINDYARITKLPISAEPVDFLLHTPPIRGDVLFALKFFELIPAKRVEQILLYAQVKWIITSFPTRTIKHEKMQRTERNWLNLLLKRVGFPYKTIEFENEIVYIIQKSR